MAEKYYLLMVETYGPKAKVKEPVEVYCATLKDDNKTIKNFVCLDPDKGVSDFEGLTKEQGDELLSQFGPEDEKTHNSERKFLLLKEEDIDINELLGIKTDATIENVDE